MPTHVKISIVNGLNELFLKYRILFTNSNLKHIPLVNNQMITSWMLMSRELNTCDIWSLYIFLYRFFAMYLCCNLMLLLCDLRYLILQNGGISAGSLSKDGIKKKQSTYKVNVTC